ncbi:MAG: plasmid mobilization relaxosome protein MobC [Pseudomonadota bacterium]
MARPRKETRRDTRIMVRFTKAEADRIREYADTAGITVSDLLRAAVLEQPLPKKRRRGSLADTQALGTVLGQIGRIGSNVNQLARLANMGDWPEAEYLERSAEDIAWIRHHVMDALGIHDTPPQTAQNRRAQRLERPSAVMQRVAGNAA